MSVPLKQSGESQGPGPGYMRSPDWDRSVRTVFAVCLIAGLWMLSRPYAGTRHDAVLYSAQALARLNPGVFSEDLYWKFGSQDDFSIYSVALAWLMSFTSLGGANLLGMLAGQLLWMLVASYLVTTLYTEAKERLLALGTLLLLPPVYGGYQIFSYAEPFQSPRLFAEAAVLLALALALRGRWWGAVASLAASLAVHPLMAIPGVLAVFALAVSRRRALWLLPVFGGTAVMGLAAIQVQPFSRLLERIDSDWWAIVSLRNSFTFLSGWGLFDYALLASHAAIALLVYLRGTPIERALIRAIAVTVAGTLLLSVVLVDLLQNLLATDIQLYRSTWLLAVSANLLVGPMCGRWVAQRSEFLFPLAGGVALYALSTVMYGLVLAACIPLWVTVLATWSRRVDHGTSRLLPLVAFGYTVLALAVGLGGLCLLREMLSLAYEHLSAAAWASSAFVAAAVLAGLSGRLIVSTLASCIALSLAIASGTRDTAWGRFQVSGPHPPPEIMSVIRESRNVYMEGGVAYSWFSLRKPAYYSCLQGTGALFYRGTAMEYARRGKVLSHLNTHDFVFAGLGPCMRAGGRDLHTELSAARLAKVCENLPELDLLVLFKDIDGVSRLEWRLPSPLSINFLTVQGLKKATYDRYFLFRCSQFREGATRSSERDHAESGARVAAHA